MLFWIVAALLTLGACLAVLLPVMRAQNSVQADTAYDLEVYQDQLAELERDMARGVIQGAEAEQARAEIGRRILKLSADGKTAQSPSSVRFGRVLTTLAVFALPLASWGIYTATGSPGFADQPLHARVQANPQDRSIDELVSRAEAHLSANPEDGRGWDVLAPIYYRMGRYNDSATAYRNAIQLAGATAARESGLGEALAALAGGTVTADAVAAFERALEIEPENPKARFLLALGLAQEGKADEAAEALNAMVGDLPADSPWRGAVSQAIAELNQGQQAAPDDAQTEMIDGMVASLDQRLRENPQDAEGWQRLVHSYAVLNRLDQARDALSRGLDALGRDSEDSATLAAFAAERGVRETATQETGDGQ